LVVDVDGFLKKVQVKNMGLRNFTIKVRLTSTNYLKGKWVNQPYEGIDWIAIYCPEYDQVYLLDPSKFSNQTQIDLKFKSNKNNQKAWLGTDYHIDKMLL